MKKLTVFLLFIAGAAMAQSDMQCYMMSNAYRDMNRHDQRNVIR